MGVNLEVHAPHSRLGCHAHHSSCLHRSREWRLLRHGDRQMSLARETVERRRPLASCAVKAPNVADDRRLSPGFAGKVKKKNNAIIRQIFVIVEYSLKNYFVSTQKIER